ncbi:MULTISPECIES: hypothetical protein [Sphingobacterium]|uniref:Uncharacterized protein n=1 Tax=Sphingobacterium zeae TaxID=1776859 RepID=A0ABU0U753_9SPHI|nr:hypothetical protein [Sphingobacterium zeae]
MHYFPFAMGAMSEKMRSYLKGESHDLLSIDIDPGKKNDPSLPE